MGEAVGVSKGAVVVLVAVGLMIGAVIFVLKREADQANESLAGVAASSFQACQDENEFNRKYSPDSGQRDCEREFLD